jgi:RNA polymerase sigma factor (TIGR02999 family)
MRHILIDNARRKSRVRHGGGLTRTDTGRLSAQPNPGTDEELLLIDEGVRELEKVDPIKAQVVVARFFGGLTNKEIADCMGIGERSVERYWSTAKVWLYRWMQESRK